MSYIYEPRGHAREYADLALNIYTGCSNKCAYCYVPAVLQRPRQVFQNEVRGRVDPSALSREIVCCRPRSRVLLCFTCDPYPHDSALTREVLKVLRYHNVQVAIVTKQPQRAVRDFDLLADMDAWFGVSLVWTDDRQRQKYEPDASTVTERLDTLSLAKSKGIVTWASVEPVIDQQQALRAIELLAPVADIIKVGRINHDARLGMQDWRSFAVESWKLVTALGKNYYFKKGLREYLTNPENL